MAPTEGAGTNPEVVPLLIQVLGLKEMDAKIYALGLEKRVVTSADLKISFGLPQPQGVQHLQKLSRQGFFTHTVPGGAGGGKAALQKFRVVPLSQTVSAKREAYRQLDRLVELDEADEELRGGQTGISDQVWVIPPKALASHFRRNAEASNRSVEIVCNDGSWVDEPEVLECIREVRTRSIPVSVYSVGLSKPTRQILASIGVRVHRASGQGPVYALVDRRLLYMPYREGRLRMEYSSLYTTNPYLVERVTMSMIAGRKG